MENCVKKYINTDENIHHMDEEDITKKNVQDFEAYCRATDGGYGALGRFYKALYLQHQFIQENSVEEIVGTLERKLVEIRDEL